MINLIERDEKEELAANKVKSVVWPITTAILAGYLLLSSGMLGWWWWWNSKQKVTSKEAESLKVQLLSLQQKNLLVSRVNDRVKFINDYLSGRTPWEKDLEFVHDDEISINKWSLDTAGIIEMEIVASTSAQLSGYAEKLTQGYGTVNLVDVLWAADKGYWKADISMDKRKL